MNKLFTTLAIIGAMIVPAFAADTPTPACTTVANINDMIAATASDKLKDMGKFDITAPSPDKTTNVTYHVEVYKILEAQDRYELIKLDDAGLCIDEAVDPVPVDENSLRGLGINIV